VGRGGRLVGGVVGYNGAIGIGHQLTADTGGYSSQNLQHIVTMSRILAPKLHSIRSNGQRSTKYANERTSPLTR
jgi:hypothetical protein